ncbi:C4-dicarboxylate TRAP transporter substrate-binding protein [Citreicella sp. C3M06]|uniref:C4-dicarboxylate TRAP transporter substrate-binding protein n=1 Tax=Citreicella sp. C3M06 TaxID=2841564 RepID=UPI001C08E6CE|nr:C4-dicarboxylate TRAP transporter substrate-binding protein [Citreicella sp. C3M06]MBU2961157.1 C4-dicarboxylate TRAP transporter substrate-binding protein [Citreicella sp. C3M06]
MKHLTKSLLGATTAMLLAMPAMAETTVRIAYENNPGEPADMVMNHWKDLVAEASDGDVVLELYPSSQLGAKKDVIEQAMLGVNVITIADVGFLTDYDPDLGILFGPFLTDDAESLFKIYESDWFKQKEAALQEQGIHIVIKNYLYGTRQLLATKKVETPEDLQGMKIRTPNNIMQIRAIEAMGGTPTPMALGDVYPALTQGVIDGVENPLPVLYGQKLHEQAKELSMISYLQNTSLWLGGQAYFDTLDPEVIEMLHETGHQAGIYSQEVAAAQDEKILEEMTAAGVTVTYPDTAPFKEKAMAVYGMFPEWSDGLYDQIQAQLAE